MTSGDSTERILVTGATGTVGQHVVRFLSETSARPVAAVRNPDERNPELPESAGTVEFDFTRPETWGAAFAEADGLFFLRPPSEVSLTGDLLPAVDAAVRSGVEHVVYLSVMGADRIPFLPHRRIERHIEGLDVAYTFLRAAFFMQNLSEVHRADVVERDELFVPAGNGETVFVDARDIGAVAAVAFTEPGHRNRAYDVTGSEKLGYDEVARQFSDVLDRPITYARPGILEFVRRMSARGHDLGYVIVMVLIYAPTRFDLTGEPTGTVEEILGREPTTMREFLAEYRASFEPMN